MGKKILCLCTVFFLITKMFAIEVIGKVNSNGDVVGSNKYIESFWSNPNVSHSASSYVEKYNMTVNTSDGYYLIHLYRHTEKADVDVIENIETFGDVFFSKLDIEYYTKNGAKVSTGTFSNDGLWYKYNYWTFATYTDHPWKETRDITAYVVNFMGDCKALVLRGERDSIDPPLLSVFMLYKGNTKLVFNKPVEVNSVNSDASRTIFEVQENKYDSNGKLIPKRYSIAFENDSIVVL
jgi:hypothetical protein